MKRLKNEAFSFTENECVIVFDADDTSSPPALLSDRLHRCLESGSGEMPQNIQMALAFARFFNEPQFRSTVLAMLAADLTSFEATENGSRH